MNDFAPQPVSDYSRLGPIGELMANPRVSEVMVMGTRDIYVEVDGKIILTPLHYASEDELMHVIRYIVESVGRSIDASSPLADAASPTGPAFTSRCDLWPWTARS